MLVGNDSIVFVDFTVIGSYVASGFTNVTLKVSVCIGMLNAGVLGVLFVVSTGRSEPVVSSITAILGFIIGVLTGHRTSTCIAESVSSLVVVLSLVSNRLLCVRTGNYVPVILSVICPILRVRMCAELLLANRTESVAFCVSVSFLALRLYVVSAGNCVPVVDKIDGVFFSIGVFVIVVPKTSVTDTVVVFISVSRLAGHINGVSAGYFMPVIFVIVGPSFSVGVLVVVVPFTAVADTVVVSVYVSCLESYLDIVSTGNFLPMVFCIVRPVFSVGVVVVVVPLTNVAETVVVLVCVSCLIGNLTGVVTDGCVPVVNFVVSPILGELVFAELLLTNFAEAVVVFVGMSGSRLSYVVSTGCFVVVLVKVVCPIAFVIGMGVIVVPKTSVTDTVVVFVNVSSLESYLDIVSTGNFLPVVFCIVRPVFSVGVVVVVVPLASVTDTVVVFVSVSCLILGLGYVSAVCSLPVVFCIMRPGFVVGMLAELILTNVTYTVVVLVDVVFGSCGYNAMTSVTGCFLPVLFAIGLEFVGIYVLVSAVITASGTKDTVLGVEGVSCSFHVCGCVTALRRTPVSGFIHSPFCRVVDFVVVTYNVFANVAESVSAVFYVNVCRGVLACDGVSASRCVPVVILVEAPEVFVVGVLVSAIPFANVTGAVVVSVYVSCKILIVKIVSTSNCMPVVLIVGGPLGAVGVLVVVVPKTSVTDTVVIRIGMRSEVLSFYGVITCSSIPVILCIVRPVGGVGVLVVVVPFAYVTDRVIVLICVLFLILRIDVASAGGLKVVVALVVRVFFVVFVLTENVVACFNIAFAVVIVILVRTGYVSLALIALKVFV